MRCRGAAVAWMAACTGQALDPEGEILPEEPEPTDACRGCGSSETWFDDLPVEDFVLVPTVRLEGFDQTPPEPLEGVFYGWLVESHGANQGQIFATFSFPLTLSSGLTAHDVAQIDIHGPILSQVDGFFDIDGDADPADPAPSEGDPLVMSEFSSVRADDGIADPTIRLSLP